MGIFVLSNKMRSFSITFQYLMEDTSKMRKVVVLVLFLILFWVFFF